MVVLSDLAHKENEMSKAFENTEMERIAQSAAKVLKESGKAMASQYIFGALESAGLYDMARPAKSKIKAWEVHAIADRSLYLSQA